MSKKPPVPAQNQSPYPIEEAPHDQPPKDNETIAAMKQIAAAKKRWSPSSTEIGIGAAVGVGSAAVVAALLYWRGNNRDGK